MTKGKILLVDDEEEILNALRRIFVREGYDVEVVNNVDLAIERISKSFFDLVISDILMDGKSGIELVQHLSDFKRYIPVV